MQLGKGKSAWKFVWIIPLVYFAVAGLEALLAGSFVGLLYAEIFDDAIITQLIQNRLGAFYNSGNFIMSTWIPFIWSLINVLVLILSSFAIQGGL
jgi:hypothetical protein